MERDLLPRARGNFRLGERLFRAKLRHTLESDLSLEEIREAATRDLTRTRKDLFATASGLYPLLFPLSHGLPPDPKSVVKEVLDKLADSHPDNGTIVGQGPAVPGAGDPIRPAAGICDRSPRAHSDHRDAGVPEGRRRGLL